MILRRRELVLARHSRDPLQTEALDPDPLTPFATFLKGLQDKEKAEVHVSLLPISPWKQSRLRRRLAQKAARQEIRIGDARGFLVPAKRVERRVESIGLYEKLDPKHSLWYVQIQLMVSARTKARAKLLMDTLVTGFAPLRGLNWLGPSSTIIPGLSDSDLPIRRSWFDWRWQTGLFWPRKRRHLVTIPEIAGFLKPPTKRCPATNVIRASEAPALVPPEVPRYHRGRRGVLPLGEALGPQGREVVGVSLEETNTALVVGRSRFGKSTIAQAWALHLALEEAVGIFMIDPHHDAIGRLKEFLSGAQTDVWDRVVEIDFSRQITHAQPGFNLFDVKSLAPDRLASRPQIIADAIAATMGWEIKSAPRVVNFVTQGAHTLIALGRRLPSAYQPTIFQLNSLLSDEKWRRQILHYLPDELREFWQVRFPQFRDESILPVTNLIDQLRQHQGMRTVLGQSVSTYDAGTTLGNAGIVLVTTGAERPGKLLANMLVYELLKTALGRANTTTSTWSPMYLLADELQRYDSGGEGYFADMLREAGKFKLFTVGFVQDPYTLHPDTRRALLQNRSHLLVTASSAEVAGLMANQWSNGPEEGDIRDLTKYHFVADIQSSGEKVTPFEITTVVPNDPRLWGQLYRPERVTQMEQYVAERKHYMTPVQVERHLAGLDEKILDMLSR